MKINSLYGAVPIVKQYSKDADGNLQKSSYPHIYEFSSQTHEVNNIQEFKLLIESVGRAGGCISKGLLTRELVSESRAGATDSESETQWICLDLDGIEGVSSVDRFLEHIGLNDIDYVLQWSSSMNVENVTGLRCHVFMLLDKPTHPVLLKSWLQHLNLSVPVLAQNLELTKTYNALSWPLDITTCQNDKLIYVAPPTFGPGCTDPFVNIPRVSLNNRTKRFASVPGNIPSPSSIRTKTDKKVNELREAKGEEARKPSKYEYSGSIEYMADPGRAHVTGIKTERGFTYLNLNGGDSWGYYHPEDNPSFIYNFKGEPTYKTSELLPDYWAKMVTKINDMSAAQNNATSKVYLVFRDLITATYYNGTYDPQSDDLDIYRAGSKEQLKDFMKQHGQPVPTFIPDWRMEFDPDSLVRFDHSTRRLNTYSPSKYFKAPIGGTTTPPPTIHKLVEHVFCYDPITVEHFYNWLAVIVQTKTKTGTAWILQSLPGSGKGTLFHQVITPIFGDNNVASKRMEEIRSQFTGFFEHKFVVFVDESRTGVSESFADISSKLKNIIAEPKVSLRSMYREAREVKNYSNLIFATNEIQGAHIEMADRRYNVGGYQKQPIRDKHGGPFTEQHIEVLIPSELAQFADYLRSRPIDIDKARFPLDNEPRRKIQKISQTSVDEAVAALKSGDLNYFVRAVESNEDAGGRRYAAHKYRKIILGYIKSLDQRTGRGTCVVTKNELQTIFSWLSDTTPKGGGKFASHMKWHDIEFIEVRKRNRLVEGLQVDWHGDLLWIEDYISGKMEEDEEKDD